MYKTFISYKACLFVGMLSTAMYLAQELIYSTTQPKTTIATAECQLSGATIVEREGLKFIANCNGDEIKFMTIDTANAVLEKKDYALICTTKQGAYDRAITKTCDVKVKE